MTIKRSLLLASPLLALAATGCDNSTTAATGSLVLAVQAEDTITGGLAAGTGEEDIVDGWNITFDRYITAVGHVVLTPVAGGTTYTEERILVLDLTTVPETGHELATESSIPEGRYTFEYENAVVTSDLERDDSVSQADFDRMVTEGCSFLIVGTAAAEDGSRTIDFDFCLDADAVYDCYSMEGVEGLVIAPSTNTAFLTIHGDHMFFNGFPEGDEGSVVRRAGWLALVDDATGADGSLTNDDLDGTAVSLLPTDEYALSGAPTIDGHAVTTMLDYVRAQVSTQGHLNGEGECLTSGVGHEHLTGL